MDDSSDNQRLLRMLSTDDGSAILATDLRKSDVPDVALDSPSLAIPHGTVSAFSARTARERRRRCGSSLDSVIQTAERYVSVSLTSTIDVQLPLMSAISLRHHHCLTSSVPASSWIISWSVSSPLRENSFPTTPC
uniref:Uncharacterized protein n=1 Tax=Halorubrum lacusprofundi TaxID=2247 RepID=A0A220SX99_9EURY|nr:hypothetical protein [Halorubrum lacusprofundi]